jgi:hypothetical protein
MTGPTYLQGLSDTQRQFVAAAEAKGATSPANARTSGELPRISARELTDLLDIGIVREAAAGSFYVYERARPAPGLEPTPAGPKPGIRRIVVMIVFWLIVVLLPLLFLRLSMGSGSGQ